MNNDNNNERGVLGNSASKSRKQILLELLQLEGEDLGNVGPSLEKMESKKETNEDINETINGVSSTLQSGTLTKPKKQLSEKQLETLKKGQEIRNANRVKRAEEKRIKEEQDKKELEEKLVKKAIALKKKQLKQQQILDEISDDENEKVEKELAEKKIIPHRSAGDTRESNDRQVCPLQKPKAESIKEEVKPKINIKFY